MRYLYFCPIMKEQGDKPSHEIADEKPETIGVRCSCGKGRVILSALEAHFVPGNYHVVDLFKVENGTMVEIEDFKVLHGC